MDVATLIFKTSDDLVLGGVRPRLYQTITYNIYVYDDNRDKKTQDVRKRTDTTDNYRCIRISTNNTDSGAYQICIGSMYKAHER